MTTVYGRRKLDAPGVVVPAVEPLTHTTEVATPTPTPAPTKRERRFLSPMPDPVRIRFRTDNEFEAEDARWRREGAELRWLNRDEPNDTPPAEPGDIWRTFWHGGPIAGYAICCPKCGGVHHWTTASNCPQDVPWEVTNADGSISKGMKCRHSGVGSCWNWTGSAEDGTLSATPSLYCIETPDGWGCGWHGFLTNGVLKHC